METPASNYEKAFSPTSPEKSVNERRFKKIIDIDDDGDFDKTDVAILAGISLAGYFAWKIIFKAFGRG